LEDNVICEINTNRHECEVEDEEEEERLPPCSAVTTPAGPCLNDEGQKDMKMCTQSEDIGSIACRHGIPPEEVCKRAPTIPACTGELESITEPQPPTPELIEEPIAITPEPEPQPQPIAPPLPDPGILPPPGKEEEEEGNTEQEELEQGTSEDTEEEDNENGESEESSDDGGGAEEESDGGGEDTAEAE
jgi:hypothetical protein